MMVSLCMYENGAQFAGYKQELDSLHLTQISHVSRRNSKEWLFWKNVILCVCVCVCVQGRQFEGLDSVKVLFQKHGASPLS